MKTGWEVRPLGDVVEIKPSKREAKERLGSDDAVSFVPMEDLKELQRTFAPKQVRPLSEVYGGYTYFAEKDVLLAKITPCFENGKLSIASGLTNGIGFGSSEFMVLRCSPHLDPQYLFYFLSRNEFREAGRNRMTGAVGHKRVPPEFVEAQPIPLPPLEEQQQIVAVLDEAFEGLTRARVHAEANLQDARELFESIKANALDYRGPDRETVVLSEVADVTSGLVDPRQGAYADLPHVGAGNMITGSDELVGVMTAREEKLISGKYLFEETMVLYSKIRPYLRKAARPDFSGLCSADVYPVAPKQGRLDRNFLFHLLLGNDFTEYAISGSDRAGMPKVNRNHMFAYTFDLPPIEAQQTIAAVIDEAHTACSELTENAKAKLQSLDDLRQSLLQKAFAGELA